MDRIMEICILVCLLCNLLTHRYLSQRIDILQEWIEVLHGIDFDKMSESVRKWQSEQKEKPQTEDAYAYDEDDWYDKTERDGE